jgi:molybdate transport system substrate-binding protein
MVKRIIALLLVNCLFLSACGVGPSQSEENAPLVIMAAASLQESLTALADQWEAKGEARPQLIFAGTSSLARQALSGAPADIFISADAQWMDQLEVVNIIAADAPQSLVQNALVLVAPKQSKAAVDLANSATFDAALGRGRLAIADPASVPAGRYAAAALEHFGLWDGLQDRITGSENVRAALALVERGETPLGIVYASDARASNKVRVIARFPAGSHPKIVYPAALLTGSNNRTAPRFLDFAHSPEGQAIFTAHGFTPSDRVAP